MAQDIWTRVQEDAWKIAGLAFFVCAGLAGHYDVLPVALQPYKDWFEFVGYVGGLVNAWRMSPMGTTPTKKEDGK